MSFRELIEALSPDEIEKITGRKPKSGVHTQSIKPEHRANGQRTVPDQEYDDSKGYGKRRYMGDDVENEDVVLEAADSVTSNPLEMASGSSFSSHRAFMKSKFGVTTKLHKESGPRHVTYTGPKEAVQDALTREHKSDRVNGTGDYLKAEAKAKKHSPHVFESTVEEGDVNYAKMHTQANPMYASGTKWRKSSAAVKAKSDDVGAGELGAHGGGSGHVAVKATMNQRDKLADRQEINALGHKTFAIKQTRLPRTSVRRPLPEGLEDMPGEFRKLVESQLNEISRSLASSYISGAKSDEHKDRSSGIKLAQKKKWGDAKFGFDEPKVKATSEEVVSEASAGHYHSLAEDAIDNATGFSPKHDEYHKWMTVHHKAMRAHYEQQGNHRMSESHDAVAEHHASHVDDDDFHNGESHHWSGF